MQHNMKEKFKSGMLRIIGNLLHNKRLVSLNEQMIASTQTEDYDLSIWKIKEY